MRLKLLLASVASAVMALALLASPAGIGNHLDVQEVYGLVENSGRPNIVVIMTDDQDDMGSMSRMSKVDTLLADNGITFTNSFVDDPLCCPSRASFLTGQAAHNHGIQSNVPPDGGYEAFLPSEGNTLPVWMQQSGYTTAFMGKYLNGYGAQNVPPEHVPPGWTSWNGIPGDIGAHSYYNYTINSNGTLEMYGGSPSDYLIDVLAQKADDFIATQQSSDKPFFVWIAPLAPHVGLDQFGGPLLAVPAPRHDGLFANLPRPEPPNFNEADVTDKPEFMQSIPLMDETLIAYTENAYRKQAEALAAVDDLVETVVDALQSAGKLDNTIIVYTSDNGYSNGEHRRPAGKQFVYEENIRVPLVIRGPGIPADETRSQLVNNLDLVATILDYSETTPGRVQDGQSLQALLGNSNTPWRTALLVQGIDQIGFSNNPYPSYTAVRSANYVYAEHTLFGEVEEEFYALYSDPYELISRHDNPAYATVMNNHKSVLDQLSICSGASCFVTSDVAGQDLILEVRGPDVNNDGVVDLLFDILLVVNAHSSECGDPGYVETYDLDSSCSIDLLTDILLTILGHGLHWPPDNLKEAPTSPLRFYLRGAEPEGASLTYGLSGLPGNASVNPVTGEFTWSPTSAQSGTYMALLTVSDGISQTSTPFPITVLDTE